MVSGTDFAAKHLSGTNIADERLAPEDEWIGKLDLVSFGAELRSLGKQLGEQQGAADMAHLRKIVWWSRLCQWAGAATMWYCVNPVSVFLLSLGCMTRWACVGHHTCHGGYDKVDLTKRYNRFTFAVGSLYRRVADWNAALEFDPWTSRLSCLWPNPLTCVCAPHRGRLDWMLVEAWNCEHNQLHHYYLGEDEDPDLVEMNLAYLRSLKLPMPIKWLFAGVVMTIWKWWYYAPNTFKVLKVNELRRAGKPLPDQATLHKACVIDNTWLTSGPRFFSIAEFVLRVVAPYFVVRFVLLPGAFGLALGRDAYANSLVTIVLAELLTNLHSFVVIVTNHAGDDLYRFEKHCAPRSATFYLRQVVSSANFTAGAPGTTLGDLNDFLHGWLNYQVEHHLWPDLSMLSYQKAAPLVKAICAKHGVPYVQQNVFWRLKKTVDIMTGAASMRRYPTAFEKADDLTSAW